MSGRAAPATYCSYILGECALGYGSEACKKQHPVECRTRRHKLEMAKEGEHENQRRSGGTAVIP